MTRLLILMVGALLLGCQSPRRPETRFEFTRPQMGLPFRLVLYAPDAATAQAAAEAAYARVAELNSILSDYDADSELSRLSQTAGQGQVVPLSPDLWLVLQRAQTVARATGGAFDVTCGPIVSLWRKARRTGVMPDPEKLREARERVGFDKLKLDPVRRTAELTVPYMRLDCGSIAKGYAVDEALRVLRQRGIRSALVTGSGDMAAGDPPPGAQGWRIELAPLDAPDAPPTEFVSIRNCALATSGDLFQHVVIAGKRYSHIVDPRTGLGLTDHGLVVAIARNCLTANSITTSSSVLGPEAGLRFAASQRGCVRIVRRPNERIEKRELDCFRDYLLR